MGLPNVMTPTHAAWRRVCPAARVDAPRAHDDVGARFWPGTSREVAAPRHRRRLQRLFIKMIGILLLELDRR